MSAQIRNALVGAVVLLALGGLSWMALTFGSNITRLFEPPQMTLHFLTKRADGLYEGSAVNYRGKTIGRVLSVRLSDDGTNVIIDATVDKSPPVPANVTADIAQDSVLGGGSIVSLEPPDGPPLGQLKSDGRLTAEYIGLRLNLIPPGITANADRIGAMSDEIAKTAQQFRESNVVHDLDDAVHQFNAQVAKAGQVLDSIQAVTGDEQSRQDIRTAIANFRQTSEATTRLSAKLDTVADGIQRDSQNVNDTVTDARKHIDDLSAQVGDRLTQISGMLASVQSIATKIDQGKGTAGQLVNDPRLYQALVDTVTQANAAVGDLRRLLEQWEQDGLSLKTK